MRLDPRVRLHFSSASWAGKVEETLATEQYQSLLSCCWPFDVTFVQKEHRHFPAFKPLCLKKQWTFTVNAQYNGDCAVTVLYKLYIVIMKEFVVKVQNLAASLFYGI